MKQSAIKIRKKTTSRNKSYLACITPTTEAILDEIVAKMGRSKIENINEAIEAYRFREKMRLLDEEFERLRPDENKWKQELEERSELEGTLGDGLE